MPNSPCFPHSRPPRKSTNAEPSSAAKRTPRAGQLGRASAQRIGGSAAGASRGDNQRGGMRPRRGSAQTSRSTQPRGTAQSRSTAQSLAVVGSPVVTGTLFQQGETLRTRIGIKIGEEPGVMSVVLTMKPNRKMLSQKALADFLPQVSSQSAIPSLLALLCWCLSL